MTVMMIMINWTQCNRLPVLRPKTDISCSDKSHTMMMIMIMMNMILIMMMTMVMMMMLHEQLIKKHRKSAKLP